MEKILREVLNEDKTLLGRRDDFIAAVEKKVPDNLRRDFATIKKAISLNVGEKFFVGNDKESVKSEVAEILKSSGMQETRINFVVETFAKALDWDKPAKKINTVKPAKKNPEKISPPIEIHEEEKISDNENSAQIKKVEEIRGNDTTLNPDEIIEQTSQNFDDLQTQIPPQQSQNISAQMNVNSQNKNSFPPTQRNSPSFWEKIKAEFFTTEGRLNRWAYFVRNLKLFGIAVIGGLLSSVLIGIPIIFVAVVGSFMICIRRLHDLNKSGWWILLSFVPYIDIVFGLYILFAPGTRGDNKFGSDPLMR